MDSADNPGGVRAIVADDDDFARAGILALLERMPGVTVVGEGNDGEEAVTAAIALRPDLAVLDLSMGPPDGVEAAQRIRYESPSTRVIILSAYAGRRYVKRALDAGARAYVAKDAVASDLPRAVEAVLRGDSYVSEQAYEIHVGGRSFHIPPWGVALCYLLIAAGLLIPLYRLAMSYW